MEGQGRGEAQGVADPNKFLAKLGHFDFWLVDIVAANVSILRANQRICFVMASIQRR
jgi:hypothetical protein